MPLFTRALAESWRGLLGWTAGIAAALFLYLPLYPTISGPDMTALLKNLPKTLVTTLNYGAISTGAGYTQATFFGLVGFLLVTIAATAWGASAIAGDEESGSLELTLAHGVTRAQVVLERAAAIVAKLIWLGLVSALIILLLNDAAGLGVGVKAFAGSLALVALTLLSASTSLLVGALTGRRIWAIAAGAGIAIVGYALNAVAGQSPDLEFLHAFSPYHWAFGTDPLVNGPDGGYLALLFGLSALLIACSALALSRRDLAA